MEERARAHFHLQAMILSFATLFEIFTRARVSPSNRERLHQSDAEKPSRFGQIGKKRDSREIGRASNPRRT